MKTAFLKYKLIQPKKTISEHKTPHPVFLTTITADPYVGCKYACPYCYALKEDDACYIKTNLVGQLSKKLEEISKTKKTAGTLPSIMIGGMTDPYQEAEKEMMVTKRCLELIVKKEFPLQVFTKSEGVLRDTKILAEHSQKGLAAVNITLFSLSDALWRAFESRVPPPEVRLEVISKLKKAGVLCGVALIPVFPYINDDIKELEKIFKEAKKAGAEYIIPGCYRMRVGKILSAPAGKAEKFNSAYGPGGKIRSEYTSVLEKNLVSLSKKYDLPLGIPAPGARSAIDLNMDPVV